MQPALRVCVMRVDDTQVLVCVLPPQSASAHHLRAQGIHGGQGLSDHIVCVRVVAAAGLMRVSTIEQEAATCDV